MSDAFFKRLRGLQEEYRSAMNASAHKAQVAASDDDMALVSMHSTESERKREAWHALQRAIAIAHDEFPE